MMCSRGANLRISAPDPVTAMSVAAALGDLARSFSRYLRAVNRSERTVTTYAEATSQLTTNVTGLDDAPGDVADIDRSHVEGYLVDVAQRAARPQRPTTGTGRCAGSSARHSTLDTRHRTDRPGLAGDHWSTVRRCVRP